MELDIPASIEEIIAELVDPDRPLVNSRLVELSDLNADKLEFLGQSWSTIELKRRRQIINRLAELAENNSELDFDDIFKILLKDEDAEVRSKAIEGLWENEESSLIEPLVNMLYKARSDDVQAASAFPATVIK
jgi:hypothetical protein